MTAVIRYLFVLIVGIAIGAAGVVYLVQSDAGNLLVRRTDVVKDLERRLEGMEQQRDGLLRSLEDTAARAGRMEQRFSELERLFRTLDAERPPATPPPTTPPPAP